ncbi:MAG: carbohydrate porin [Candidatus Omnitrophica bacterium]|nr:carbohydrate porin [Candidatus Omnitrophota bacterium]
MARYVSVAVVFFIACVACVQNVAWASEEELMAEIKALKEKLAEMDQLKARVAELEKQVGEQRCSILETEGTVKEVKEAMIQYKPGEGLEVKPYGLSVQADATFVVQGTPDANNAGGKSKSRCDASWSSDIFIEKAFDDWGLALIHLEPGQGDTVESELSLYSNVNRDANNTEGDVPITELWYEQYLLNKQLILTFGKLDPANYLDQNEYAFDETTQFLGRIFRNSPVVEWPNDNTFGSTLTIAPEAIPYFAANASYFNANNTWEDIFDKPFVSTQLTFMLARAFGLDEEKWNGNYRVYGWYNGLNHSKLVRTGEINPDNNEKRNFGFGFSFDQMLTDRAGVFARFGWQRGDINMAGTSPNTAPVEIGWSAGLELNGKTWNREDDVLAVAVGQVFPSEDYKDAGHGGKGEGHLEAYYRLQITKWLALSPDYQLIWNPAGDEGTNPIFVYGTRGQIDF